MSIHFLGSSLTFMMVYVWGRRNEYVRMSFLVRYLCKFAHCSNSS